MALSYSWNTITSAQTDADSPLDTTLMEGIRQNLIHLQESLYSTYTASTAHNHDGSNSADIRSNATAGDYVVAHGLYWITTYGQAVFSTGSSVVNTNIAEQIYVGRAGQYRVRFQFCLNSSAAVGSTMGAQIFQNGSAVGTSAITTSKGTFIQYSEDLTFNSSDVISLCFGSNNDVGYWKNFELAVANPYLYGVISTISLSTVPA